MKITTLIVVYLVITLLISLVTLLLKTQKLNKFDKTFSITMVIVGLILYIALFFKIVWLVDVLHYIILFSFICSLNFENKLLMSIWILFSLMLFFMWGLFGSCPLNELSVTAINKYDTLIECGVSLILIILIIKIMSKRNIKV